MRNHSRYQIQAFSVHNQQKESKTASEVPSTPKPGIEILKTTCRFELKVLEYHQKLWQSRCTELMQQKETEKQKSQAEAKEKPKDQPKEQRKSHSNEGQSTDIETESQFSQFPLKNMRSMKT